MNLFTIIKDTNPFVFHDRIKADVFSFSFSKRQKNFETDFTKQFEAEKRE